MLKKLFSIIGKDFRILLRSKESALIVVLGPLLLVLLVSMAFNTTGVHDIKVGTFSLAYSELSNSLVDTLRESQFDVKKIETEQECIDAVKSGDVHVCIIMPPDLDIKNNFSNEIQFYVDNSRINLVYIIIDQISNKIQLRSSQISLQLTQELVDQLQNTRTEILNRKSTVAELINSNSQASSNVNDISTNAANIDVDIKIKDIDISKLKNQSQVVKNSCAAPCNSTEATAVYDTIVSLETKLEAINTKADAILTAKNNIDSKIGSLKDIVSKDSSNIKSVDESLNKITTGIESVKVTSAETIVNPIKPVIKPITQPTKNLSYLFPTLVVLVIMFISLLLSTLIVVREKNTPAYFRNFITPTREFTFLVGTYLTNLLTVVIQLIIVFGLAVYFLKQEIIPVLLNTSVILLLIATTFILLGMTIGYLFNSEETAIIASISIASFLLFFSNTILPIETIPDSLKNLALFNPFVIADTLLKKMILFQASLPEVLNFIYMLASYLAIFFVLAFIAREATKRRV